MNEVQVDNYRVVEETPGQAFNGRIAKLSDPEFVASLGPQDLVTIAKHDSQKKTVGSFFYVAGLDTSDPASIAVWLKQLMECIQEKPQLWFGKNVKFTLEWISFTTWNIFKQCDMTIKMYLPGTFEIDFVDKNRNKLQFDSDEDTDMAWAEAFISGKMRDIMCMVENRDDGEVINVVETRIYNPLMTGQLDSVDEMFFKLFPLFFPRGIEVGCPCIYGNMPSTLTNNYLVETLCEIVRFTKSIDLCLPMLHELKEAFGPLVNIIIARINLTNDKELDGIKLIHDTLQEIKDPTYQCELLLLQAKYLLKHDDPLLALEASQRGVDLTPNAFMPWFYLVKSYIALGDNKNALLSLNSLPMNLASLAQKYQYRRILNTDGNNATVELHLPLPLDVVLDEVTNLNSLLVMEEHKIVNPVLYNLKSANLKNTFQWIYELLCEIVKSLGWEKLLQLRAELFLMEEEYDHLDATSETESEKEVTRDIRGKRLCERWFDNLFMLLYDDLRVHSQWQSNELKPETTLEWELIGLCCFRLRQFQSAKAAFQNGLQKRFSSQSSRKLLQILLMERESNPSEDTDLEIITICVKLCCWSHRWYAEFSMLLLDAMAKVVENLGITRVENEVNSRFPESVSGLFHDNILRFFQEYSNNYYDE